MMKTRRVSPRAKEFPRPPPGRVLGKRRGAAGSHAPGSASRARGAAAGVLAPAGRRHRGTPFPRAPGLGGLPQGRRSPPRPAPLRPGALGAGMGPKGPNGPTTAEGRNGSCVGPGSCWGSGQPPRPGLPGGRGMEMGPGGSDPRSSLWAAPSHPGKGGSAVSSPLGATTRPPPAQGSPEPCTCPRPLDPTAGGQWGQAGLNPPGQGH